MRRSDAHHPSVLSFGRDCGIGVKTVFERKRVACIAGGWKHSVLCSTAGDVYIWGWTPDLSIENSSSPQLVKPLALHRALNNVRFVKVAAGGDFSLALTEHGSVWSFGGNAEGQCGFAPNEFGAVPVPMLLLSLHKVNVTEVACGGAHCLARTDAGSVLSWGRGKHGCLGHGDEVARSTPTRVKALINVTGLACGWSHSLCVDSGGKVWAWGKGSDGQLGFGRGQTSDVSTPRALLFFLTPPMLVVGVAAGLAHSAVVAGPRRELFVFGSGARGQLGLGNDESASLHEPRLVEALLGRRIAAVVCGGAHTLALTEDGSCWAWGDNEFGQIGADPKVEDARFRPEMILEKKTTTHIAAGCWHSFVVCHDKVESSPRSGGLSHVSSRETLSISEDEDVRGLALALQQNQESSHDQEVPQQGLLARPGTVTVQGLLIPKPIPARDSSMRVGPQLTVPASDEGGNPLVRVGSFLAGLLGREEGPVDAATVGGAREAQEATAMQRAVAMWRKEVLSNWESVRTKKKLEQLVFKGVPAPVRGEVWVKMLGNRLNLTPQAFEMFALRAKEEGSTEMHRLILVDLPRTFPRLQLFQEHCPLHDDLTRVLEAFAVSRSELGYVQGMSFVAAVLMLHMGAAEAFICMSNLLTSHFFVSLFQLNIRECLKHIRIYELLFSKHLPTLYSHMQNLGVSPEHYLLDYFFTAFSRSLPLPVVARAWDCFFLESERPVFLFRVVLAVLKLHESELMNCNLEQIVPLLRKLPEDVTEESLFRMLEQITVPQYIHQFIERIVKSAD